MEAESVFTIHAKEIVNVLEARADIDDYRALACEEWHLVPTRLPQPQWSETVYRPMRDAIYALMDTRDWMTPDVIREFGGWGDKWLFDAAWEQAMYFLSRGEYRSMLPFGWRKEEK